MAFLTNPIYLSARLRWMVSHLAWWQRRDRSSDWADTSVLCEPCWLWDGLGPCRGGTKVCLKWVESWELSFAAHTIHRDSHSWGFALPAESWPCSWPQWVWLDPKIHKLFLVGGPLGKLQFVSAGEHHWKSLVAMIDHSGGLKGKPRWSHPEIVSQNPRMNQDRGTTASGLSPKTVCSNCHRGPWACVCYQTPSTSLIPVPASSPNHLCPWSPPWQVTLVFDLFLLVELLDVSWIGFHCFSQWMLIPAPMATSAVDPGSGAKSKAFKLPLVTCWLYQSGHITIRKPSLRGWRDSLRLAL